MGCQKRTTISSDNIRQATSTIKDESVPNVAVAACCGPGHDGAAVQPQPAAVQHATAEIRLRVRYTVACLRLVYTT